MLDDETQRLKQELKKRLELELELPLTPKSSKQIEKAFNDSIILIDNYPIITINLLKIGDKTLHPFKDYLINENDGTIYLNKNHTGLLYIEYIYGLKEEDYNPILELMLEDELDSGWNKNATSISENDVSVSYDTSLGRGALIQSMINDLKNRYKCHLEMI